MTKNVKIGTRYHLSFEKAYAREMWKGRLSAIGFIIVMAVFFAINFTAQSYGWVTVNFVTFVLGVLIILRHWSPDAVTWRTHSRTSKTRLL